MMLKLNGGRTVAGILRGFDPFMNVVIDETVEECRDGTRNNIGMVVSKTKRKCSSNTLFIPNHSIRRSFEETVSYWLKLWTG